MSSDRLKIVNLTPHDIVVEYAPGKRNVYPASGHVARVLTSEQAHLGTIIQDGTPVYERQVPVGMEMTVAEADRDADGVIVSMFAGAYYMDSQTESFTIKTNIRTPADRLAVYVPDTGPGGVLRDEKGAIIGVRRLLDYSE